MGTRRFRHPGLALSGAALFLFMGVSDALGMKRCVHHSDAHSTHTQNAEPSQDHAHVPDHAAGHAHHQGGHTGHPTEVDPAPHHAGDQHSDEDGPAHQECDCGVSCVGMTGPPPVEPGAERPFEDAPASSGVTVRAGAEEDLKPVSRPPYLLPFPNGPPAASLQGSL